MAGTMYTTSRTYYDSYSYRQFTGTIVYFLWCYRIEKSLADTLTICDGDSIQIHGIYQLIAGVYTDILQTLSGCDRPYQLLYWITWFHLI